MIWSYGFRDLVSKGGVLRAFDGDSLALLWSSDDSSAGTDDVGQFENFGYTTIANGKVFVLNWGSVAVEAQKDEKGKQGTFYPADGELVMYSLGP